MIPVNHPAASAQAWQAMVRGWRRECQRYPSSHPAFVAPELRTKPGSPYWLQPDKPRELGVLLVHGFLASPYELRPLAVQLCLRGYCCFGVRLAGHGTSPLALASVTAEDWLDSIAEGYALLARHCRRIVLIGFSTGGLLALYFAARRVPGMQGVISICAPATFADRSMELVPLLNTGRRLWQALSGWQTPMFRLSEPEYPRINYRNMPLSALAALHDLVDDYQRVLADVEVPVTLMQSTEDPVVSPESATLLAQALPGNPQVDWMVSERHNIVRSEPERMTRWVLQRLARLNPIVPPAGLP